MSKRKKKTISVIAIIVLLTVAIVGTLICISILNHPTESANGVVGRVVNDWDTGIEEESSAAQSGGTQIPGYSSAEMNSGDMVLHLSIGNPKANKCGFYATLKLVDGTELYKSELLKPGYGLTEVPLSQTLEKGTYQAVVYYQCVTLSDDEKPLNSAESEFTLIVN